MARSPWPEMVATTPLPHWRWTTSSPGARPRSRAPRWRPASRSAGVDWRSKDTGGPGDRALKLLRPAPNAGLESPQPVELDRVAGLDWPGATVTSSSGTSLRKREGRL
jgi:hypothetical protein